MQHKKVHLPILVADDDLEDCEMIREALEESRLLNDVHFVHDGEELLNYLRHKKQFENHKENPMPAIILLDLNMHKKDGREALKEIKADARLKQIPIVVLTTSKAEEDIFKTYNLGANSFISKPVDFGSLVQIMKDLGRYWFEVVELPEHLRKGD